MTFAPLHLDVAEDVHACSLQAGWLFPSLLTLMLVLQAKQNKHAGCIQGPVFAYQINHSFSP